MYSSFAQVPLATRLAAFGLSTIFAAALMACGGDDSTDSRVETPSSEATPDPLPDAERQDAVEPGEEEGEALTTGPTTPIGDPPARTRSDTPLGELSPPVPGALNMVSIELAQTHVLTNGKKTWSEPQLSNPPSLRLVDNRETFALVRLPSPAPENPQLEIWRNGKRVHRELLLPPSALPPTEDSQERYAPDLYSAYIPAGEIMPGIELRVSAPGYAPGNSLALDIAPEAFLTVRVLPVYLFGANEVNSNRPLPSAAAMSPERLNEYRAMVPWNVDVEPHGAVKIERETQSNPPSGGKPAYVQRADGEPGSPSSTSIAIGITHSLNVANGDYRAPIAIYSPISYRTVNDKIVNYTGGQAFQGKWWTSTGPFSFDRIFAHELGHNMQMPHLPNTTASPYPEASLKGSAWGWDSNRRTFIPPWVTPTASNYKTCTTSKGRQFDAEGRCVKNSVMENGYSDKATGRAFNMYSDYEIARGHREVMTKTTQFEGAYDDDGNPLFIRYNAAGNYYEMFNPPTLSYAQDGIAQNFPRQVNVPVYAIGMAWSNTTPEVNQFYKPLYYRGNMLGTIDPTNEQDRLAITPTGQGIYRNYCRSQGCDFTLRMTYADGSTRHQLLQRGFRASSKPSEPIVATATDPLNANSFRSMTVNVPGDKRLIRVELLSTPEGWKGLGEAPQVVMSKDLPQ